jgi:hypothetical protein
VGHASRKPALQHPRSGEIYARAGKRWKLIGVIKPEHKADGLMTPVKE